MVKELVSVYQATLQVHVQSEGHFHPLDLLRIGRALDVEYVVELFWSSSSFGEILLILRHLSTILKIFCVATCDLVYHLMF